MNANPLVWSGRLDSSSSERFHQKIQAFSSLRAEQCASPAVALLRFACDAGVVRNHGRAGARLGPRALCAQLANLCLPEDFSWHLYEAGEVICPADELEKSQQELAQHIHAVRAAGCLPLILGGGHETAWATFQGIKPSSPARRLGVINFDAHFDLRPLQGPEQLGNSGTAFNQIAQWYADNSLPFDYSCIGIQPSSNSLSLWRRSQELGVGVVTAEDLHLRGSGRAEALIEALIERCDEIYLSLCLDVFAAAYAPGVSAPAPLGLTPWQVLPLLQILVASGKVVAMDVVELSPPFDEGQRTAKLAAAMVMAMLNALPSKKVLFRA